MNGFAQMTTKFSLMDQSDLAIHFDHAKFHFTKSDFCFASLENGDLWKLTLHKDGRFVNRFQLQQVPFVLSLDIEQVFDIFVALLKLAYTFNIMY